MSVCHCSGIPPCLIPKTLYLSSLLILCTKPPQPRSGCTHEYSVGSMAVESITECSSINKGVDVMAYATYEYQLNKLDCVFKSVVSANFSVLETLINSQLAILKKNPTILL